MKPTKALGVALMVALSGSLLIGCTSDSSDTATTPSASAPAMDPELVGWYWTTDFPKVVGLDLIYPGKWTARSWGWLEGQGTYELDGDTITWHGGIECADRDEGTYTYTVQDRQRFTQTVKEDPCDSRRESFDGVVFKRVSPPNEELLTMDKVEQRLARAGLMEPREAWAEGNQREWNCGDSWQSRYSDSAVIVVVDDMTFVIDDPNLDPDTVSEILGGPVTPFKEYCGAG
jgi:hypothetical protein